MFGNLDIVNASRGLSASAELLVDRFCWWWSFLQTMSTLCITRCIQSENNVVTPMNFQICCRRAALSSIQLTTKSGVTSLLDKKCRIWMIWDSIRLMCGVEHSRDGTGSPGHGSAGHRVSNLVRVGSGHGSKPWPGFLTRILVQCCEKW